MPRSLIDGAFDIAFDANPYAISRPPVVGHRGMVATAQPLAAQAADHH
jgi:gamma-glutamyltranspeptidase